MYKKRIATVVTSILMGMTLVGCNKSNQQTTELKQGGTPLQVEKNDHTINLTAIHFSAFDKNNQTKAEVKTTPDAKVYIKNPVKNNSYSYKINPQGKGKYQIIFYNKGLRNEDRDPTYNYIVAKSPSYTKSAQSKIGLHTTIEGIKQSLLQNANNELKKNDILNEKLNGQANVSVEEKNDPHSSININIETNNIPIPPTDVVVAALKGIKNVDMSTFKDVTVRVMPKGYSGYWYKFIPYDIKTMPLDNIDTNDLNYISLDNNFDN